MDYFIIALLGIFTLFCLSGIAFSMSDFWQELRASYPCNFRDYRKLTSPCIEGRFVYCFDNFWTSWNNIDVRVEENFVYMGHSRPFSLLIRPVKINKSDFIYDGERIYWFRKRPVYSLAEAKRIKFALPAPLE